MNKTYRFVGGPIDGQSRTLSEHVADVQVPRPLPVIFMYPASDPPVTEGESHRYVKRRLPDTGEEVFIPASPADAFGGPRRTPLYRCNAGLFASDIDTYLDDPTWQPQRDDGQLDLVTASVRNELARFRYKPNVTLTADPPWPGSYPGGQPRVRVEMMALDSRGTGQVRPVVSGHTVPSLILDRRLVCGQAERSRQFAMWLREVIGVMELHEVDEWLRCDGELVSDPHPKPEPKPPEYPHAVMADVVASLEYLAERLDSDG